MNLRVRRARAAFGDLQRLRLWSPTSTVLDQLALARGLPAPQERVLVHGDLHFRHLLVEGRSLTGVIDWGDVCLGAPAMDLQVAWSFFPPAVRPAFLAAYGPVSEDELLRARILAYDLNAVLALYGHRVGNRGIRDEAVASVRRAAASY
jgi:aminoglycoside phosphotransferase (APT) family kinase protein